MTVNVTPFTPGSVLTAAQMNNLPMGYNDGASATATTSLTAATQTQILSKSMTIYAGRRYKITGQAGFQPSANSTGNYLFLQIASQFSKVLWYRGDQIPANFPQYVGGSYITTATAMGVTTGSASRTFNLFIRLGGAAALNTNPDGQVGANSAEQILWIEDMGNE
jgi:hypothetical protein